MNNYILVVMNIRKNCSLTRVFPEPLIHYFVDIGQITLKRSEYLDTNSIRNGIAIHQYKPMSTSE